MPGREPLPQSVALAPALCPGPTLPFLVKNNSNRFDIKKQSQGMGLGKENSFLVL